MEMKGSICGDRAVVLRRSNWLPRIYSLLSIALTSLLFLSALGRMQLECLRYFSGFNTLPA